ncbi:MAG: sodium:solute symporter family protein [Bdellovibrionota bacterium]
MPVYLGVSIANYLLVMIGVAIWSHKKVKDEKDFIVAGRRLPASLATATLLATWFGAGTLLTATDEIRYSGLPAAALEPYGAGLCLILAGIFFARPLWEAQILTLSDFYRNHFGRKAEVLSVFFTVPGYIGWIAVQIVACAGIISLMFGISMQAAIVAVAVVATFYTLLGGMWSVTLTDAVQMVIIMVGVVILGYTTLMHAGSGSTYTGIQRIWEVTPPSMRTMVPYHDLREFFAWGNLLVIASLGNIPGQDLAQRIFSSKSPKAARQACFMSGTLYILLGTIPVIMGLAARQLLPASVTHAVLPALAQSMLSPGMSVVFVLSVLSVVLSTIDSAILAAACPLSENFLRRYVPASVSSLKLCQYSVLAVSLCSLALALSGAKAYDLLEKSYTISLVGLFVPLCAGLYMKHKFESSALWSMGVGVAVWSLEFFVDEWVPVATLAVVSSFVTYWLHSRWIAARGVLPKPSAPATAAS